MSLEHINLSMSMGRVAHILMQNSKLVEDEFLFMLYVKYHIRKVYLFVLQHVIC
jgi:hypothetical protein